MPVCIRRLVRRCIRLFLRQRIGSLFLTPPAVQQGLEHVDLTLQFVDTTYLLRNQQVASVIVLLFAGGGEDDGATLGRYVEIGFAAGTSRK